MAAWQPHDGAVVLTLIVKWGYPLTVLELSNKRSRLYSLLLLETACWHISTCWISNGDWRLVQLSNHPDMLLLAAPQNLSSHGRCAPCDNSALVSGLVRKRVMRCAGWLVNLQFGNVVAAVLEQLKGWLQSCKPFDQKSMQLYSIGKTGSLTLDRE